jgi:hypothetical protein
MKNIVTDFGINCESKFGIGLIGSMYFAGEALGSMVYIIFATQLRGSRIKHVILKNFLMMITLICLVLFFRQLFLLYIGIFTIGLCCSISIIQAFAFNLEMMPLEHRNLVNTVTSMLDKVLLAITTLILKYYGSNWIDIMIPGLVSSFVATILVLFAIDSPQFHHD